MAGLEFLCRKCGTPNSVKELVETQVSAEVEKRSAKQEAKLKEWASQRENEIRKELLKELKEKRRAEFEDLKEQVEEGQERLEAYRKQEMEFRKEMRKLEVQKQEIELEVQRKLDEELKGIYEKARLAVSEEHALQIAEREKAISELHGKIQELERKSSQKNSRIAGEVLELSIEGKLEAEFPQDRITPIAKGKNGADILQEVIMRSGDVAGKLLWEAKRTSTWEEKRVLKLKDDQRKAGADIAIMVTEVFPKGENRRVFPHDGIWVTDCASVLGLGHALRLAITETHQVKRASAGKSEKMEVLFEYLTGPRFRQQVEAIVQAFRNLQSGIENEKAAMQRLWSKRERELERILSSTVGMYSDLEGLIGTKMVPIRELELAELEAEE